MGRAPLPHDAGRLAARVDAMMLRPFFSFYGGKWRVTPKHYPPPEHDTIVEPFAGGAGFSLRYSDRRVVLCDLDPVIAGVWRYLVSVSPGEIRAIPDMPLDGSVDDLPIPQEARWLVGFWLNRGGSRPKKRPSAWMRNGIRPGSFWGERCREVIASQVESIRHWEVLECDYRDCPVSGAATWFIDPPYENAGKHYRLGSSGIDYKNLGEWCLSRQGQVIVCESDGAQWLPFEPLAHIKTTRRNRPSKEAIWLKN